MSDRPPVWVDGAMVPAEAATVGLQAHSLHYGTAVFDGGRFYRADDGRVAVFRLADHVRRLLVSARSLYMELAHDEDALIEASLAVVAASGRGEGYVRQLAFYGDEAIGIGASNPTRVAIAAWTPRGALGQPLRVRIAGFGHGGGWLPCAKHAGFYGRSFLALREARATGCDDALFLGPDGTLAEATGSTIFAVIDGRLVTPPLSMPILPGITRDTLLRLAEDAGIEAREEPLPRHRALTADELFLANSAAEIRPVIALDGHPIAGPGPITRALSERYRDAVRGRDPRRRGWLAWVGGEG
ncbi:MAG: aminotransferase class IV [Myxococcales bacterium]|nr:aminotransferase class IV [Myxococcales bacterium]